MCAERSNYPQNGVATSMRSLLFQPWRADRSESAGFLERVFVPGYGRGDLSEVHESGIDGSAPGERVATRTFTAQRAEVEFCAPCDDVVLGEKEDFQLRPDRLPGWSACQRRIIDPGYCGDRLRDVNLGIYQRVDQSFATAADCGNLDNPQSAIDPGGLAVEDQPRLLPGTELDARRRLSVLRRRTTSEPPRVTVLAAGDQSRLKKTAIRKRKTPTRHVSVIGVIGRISRRARAANEANSTAISNITPHAVGSQRAPVPLKINLGPQSCG
jgi:hypothetical protein